MTKPSNSLSHGLSSRAAAEAVAPLAEELAKELIAGAPETPDIWSTARQLANAFLQLNAIGRAKHGFFQTGRLTAIADRGDARPGNVLQPHSPAADGVQAPTQDGQEDGPLQEAYRAVTHAPRMLARLNEYERKAFSKRNKLLIRLDYLILEERRLQERRTRSQQRRAG